ncbi:MAG TPA: VOC family protein [Cellvibrionaceae bacterium]
MSQPVFHINHRFNAPLHKVWQAFTTAEGLSAWMAPEHTQINCLYLEPSTGGHLHYSLNGDAADTFFGRWDFLAVAPFQYLQYTLAFSDANGSCIRHPQAPDWPLKTLVQVTFVAETDSTRLEVSARADPASTSTEIACFTGAFEQLAENWQEAFAALEQYFAAPSHAVITHCLWFEGNAEEAVSLYSGLFPHSSFKRAPPEHQLSQAEAGIELPIEFTLAGQRFLAINCGPDESLRSNSTLSVTCLNQAQMDAYRKALIGESETQTGAWVVDRFGIRWHLSLLQP